MRHTAGATLRGVRVQHVGGYGVLLGEGARGCQLHGSNLADLGGGGVRIGTMMSHPDPERNPSHDNPNADANPDPGTMELSRHNPNANANPDPGTMELSRHNPDANANPDPGTMELSRHPAYSNAVVHTRIVSGGHVFREGVGVLVHRSQGNRIEGCEIAELSYTGVSLGWEWGYAEPSGGGHNVVAGNWIHHIGRWDLADMGGVYVLGASAGTLIERNVIAHVSPYHVYGWGVYLDEGASGVLVRGNLVHHTWSAGFHQHFGFNNTFVGNIFACAGEADGDLALSIGEAHESFVFRRNTVLRCPGWAGEARAGTTTLSSSGSSGSGGSGGSDGCGGSGGSGGGGSGSGGSGGEEAGLHAHAVIVGANGRTGALAPSSGEDDDDDGADNADDGAVDGADGTRPLGSVWQKLGAHHVKSTQLNSTRVGAHLPETPAMLFWWKGEGQTPNVSLDENVYFSLQPAEASEGEAPAHLHFLRRGRTFRKWQRLGQDARSKWAHPGLRDPASCDFRPRPPSAAGAEEGPERSEEGWHSEEQTDTDAAEQGAAEGGASPRLLSAAPRMAAGRLAAGFVAAGFVGAGFDGTGCGSPALPGGPSPRPPPSEEDLDLPPTGPSNLADLADLLADLALFVPSGVGLLRAHERAQALQARKQREAA